MIKTQNEFNKNSSQQLEYQKIKDYSVEIINEHLNMNKTTLKYIGKIIDGYSIYRSKSSAIKLIIKINIFENVIEIKQSI
jgi:hypothetical protein